MHVVTRAPAVAGTFYPAAPNALAALVDDLLAAARPTSLEPCPKALIVPHAGYVYSGPIAAAGFARLAPYADRIERVILIGPTHRVFVTGLAWPDAERLRTPLGEVEVDTAALAAVPQVAASEVAHAREHALEVELPFLQRVAPHARIVPLAGSRASAAEVGAVLEALWGGPETVIVVSSDLSHYLPYRAGRARDERTADRILDAATDLDGDDACGAMAVNGLAWVARRRRLRIELLDLRSSGDTAGGRDEVVGYGAFALYEVAS
ncbi:MAG: AmmeMemoRadiSam system protein B [Myxococcales bacterium]|nr:AmmeMemoRadiSam system protein B [Myxococcales bacterium]